MGLALTWWGWSGLVAAVGVILGLWARHAWRAAVRQELVDYLAHGAPQIEIAGVRAGALVYRARAAGAPVRTFTLYAFYRELAGCPGGSAEAEAARLEVFAAVAAHLRGHGVDGGAAPGTAHVEADPLRRAS